MEELLQEFLKRMNNKYGNANRYYWGKRGRKFYKVIMNSWGQDSVYCFIDNAGFIYKAASWRVPAQHARGNIKNVDPLDGCEVFSPKYLK